jgi:striatin 1/3/4
MTISPLSPMSVITASVDCTLRVWDLSKKTSVQDLQGHRSRAGEGVVGVASHPELPIIASAGADGVVRLWAAT